MLDKEFNTISTDQFFYGDSEGTFQQDEDKPLCQLSIQLNPPEDLSTEPEENFFINNEFLLHQNNVCNIIENIHLIHNEQNSDSNALETLSTITSTAEKQKSLQNLNFNIKLNKGKNSDLKIGDEVYEKIKIKYQNIPRKYKPDGVRKKIKVHFLKYIKEILDKFLSELKIKSKLEKLNQKIISKVNIKVMHQFLIDEVSNIYQKDENDYNKNLVRQLLNSNREDIKMFLITPLWSHYDSYLVSHYYQKHFYKLVQKESDDDYLELYQEFAGNFILYFFSTDPNTRSDETNKKRKKQMEETEDEDN